MGAGKPIGESFQPGRDYSVGGQVYSGQTGQVIGNLGGSPSANRPVRSQRDNQIELVRQREAQARAQAEFARAQAQRREEALRSGQAAPSSQTYNRQPIAPPGVSDTPGVPGTGSFPFPFGVQAAPQGARTDVTPFRGSDLRVQREKENKARLEQVLASRRQLEERLGLQRAEAQRRQDEMVAQRDADRYARQQAQEARLNEQRSGRLAAENAFRARLAETRDQYNETQRGRRMENRLTGAARQEQMQRQFAEAQADAASRGRNDVIRQLEAEEANATPQFENEDGFSIDAYQQLLNRLRQFRSNP